MNTTNLNEAQSAQTNQTLAGQAERCVIRKRCDCCEEEWEEEFFCKKCSGVQSYHGEMVLEPNPFWDGNPGDEYEWREREPEYMDICMNCCGNQHG